MNEIIDLAQTMLWIGEQLGEAWTQDDQSEGRAHCLKHPLSYTDRCLRLFFEMQRVQGWRIEISVGYDDLWAFWRNEDAIHKITVSADKTPAQIARDVERRLLPHYESRFRAAVEKRKAHEREIMDRWAMIRELAAIINGKVSHDDRVEYPETYAYFGSSDKVEFKADYHGRVDIEIKSVPLDVAKWIARIAWLKLIRQAKPEENE